MSNNGYTDRPAKEAENGYEGCPMSVEVSERDSEKPGKNSKALKGKKYTCETGPEKVIAAKVNTCKINEFGEIIRSTEPKSIEDSREDSRG